MFNNLIFRLKKIFVASNSKECKKYCGLCSDGVHCNGYSANWIDDADECKKCPLFIRSEK